MWHRQLGIEYEPFSHQNLRSIIVKCQTKTNFRHKITSNFLSKEILYYEPHLNKLCCTTDLWRHSQVVRVHSNEVLSLRLRFVTLGISANIMNYNYYNSVYVSKNKVCFSTLQRKNQTEKSLKNVLKYDNLYETRSML